MKGHHIFIVLGLMLLLTFQTGWASDQFTVPEEMPAIMTSLDTSGLTTLDDTSIAGIRGQAYSTSYVLVKVLGINTFDFGPGVKWTWNPLGYRYGYWGGPGWTNGGDLGSQCPYVADTMDALFMQHDLGNISDQILLAGLAILPNKNVPFWGQIYCAKPVDAPKSVYVSGVSFLGSRFYRGWRKMPYSEYSRREAVAGMTAFIIGKSLFPSILP